MLRSLSWPPRPPAAPARRLARHAVVCPGMSSRLAMHDPHLPFFSSTLIQFAKIRGAGRGRHFACRPFIMVRSHTLTFSA